MQIPSSDRIYSASKWDGKTDNGRMAIQHHSLKLNNNKKMHHVFMCLPSCSPFSNFNCFSLFCDSSSSPPPPRGDAFRYTTNFYRHFSCSPPRFFLPSNFFLSQHKLAFLLSSHTLVYRIFVIFFGRIFIESQPITYVHKSDADAFFHFMSFSVIFQRLVESGIFDLVKKKKDLTNQNDVYVCCLSGETSRAIKRACLPLEKKRWQNERTRKDLRGIPLCVIIIILMVQNFLSEMWGWNYYF